MGILGHDSALLGYAGPGITWDEFCHECHPPPHKITVLRRILQYKLTHQTLNFLTNYNIPAVINVLIPVPIFPGCCALFLVDGFRTLTGHSDTPRSTDWGKIFIGWPIRCCHGDLGLLIIGLHFTTPALKIIIDMKK